MCDTQTIPTMIACYARVSPPDQNLSRQVRSVLPYVEGTFDVEIDQKVGEVADYVADETTSDDPIPLASGDAILYYDRLTGTSTDCEGPYVE